MNLRTAFFLLAVALTTATPAFAFWGSEELATEKVAVQFAREVVDGGYRIVRTDELKQWLDAGTAGLIVDTMPLEASYRKNHLPGAVHMEFPIPAMEELGDAARAALEALLGPDKDRRLVFYCGFTKCGRSHNGALWAVRLGYRNVYRHPGGIKGWLEAGYPVEEGAD